MTEEYEPCGGCGNDRPNKRCIGCFHDFGGSNGSIPYPGDKPPTVTANSTVREADAGPDLLSANAIAEALEACDWSGAPIGNKSILRAAAHTLRCFGEAAKRETFEVPEGFEAVRDDDGHATGELQPVTPITTVKVTGGLWEQLTVLSGYYITQPPTPDHEFVQVCNGDLRKMVELMNTSGQARWIAL